jgi:hypothetical protein
MMGGAPPYDRQTAVYDIAAKTVYLPDGTSWRRIRASARRWTTSAIRMCGCRA